MLVDVAGIVFDAEDETRFSAAHERQTEHVHSGRLDNTPIVFELPLAVEYGYIEPVVVRPKARGPNDRPDIFVVDIHGQRRFGLDTSVIEALAGWRAIGVGAHLID